MMKVKAIKFWTKIISACLVLLGFNACSDDKEPEEIWVEYGSPSAEFKITGKVVSAEDEKHEIGNIRVVIVPDNAKIPDDELQYAGDTAKTSPYGEFLLGNKYFYTLQPKHKVIFEDIDGEANGGTFETQEIAFEVDRSDFVNGGRWHWGTLEKDLGTIKLVPKKEDTEEPKEPVEE